MIELRRRYNGGKGSDSPSFSRLPKEYQEVDYIKNISRSYIKLPIKQRINSFYRIDATVMYEASITPYDAIWGYFTYPESGDYFDLGVVDSGLRFRFAQSTVFSNINISKYTKHRINVNSISGTYLDKELINNSTSVNIWDYDAPMGVFARYDYFNQRPDYFFLGRIYSFEMYENENKIINFIPCYRISDRVAGMYDIVNDVFYTNAGEGEFTVGPDVHYNIPFEYQQVEYLETQGDGAYIKTNVPYDSTQDDYVLTCKYLILSHSRFSHIFGASEGDSYSSIVFAQNAASNSYLAFFNKACTSQHYVISTTNGFGNATTCIMRMLQMTISDESFIPIKEGTDGIVSRNKTEFCLFKANQNNSTSSFIRAYEFVIEKGSNILCNLIPCYRKEDDVAGMYDLVSGEFYTNAGAGEFIVGPDVIG